MADSDTPTPVTRTTRPLTPEQRARKQERFLKAFRESGNIKASCKAVGVDRSTYYAWRDSDSAFKALLPEAMEEANDTLEFAAYDRAVRGVQSYVVSMGKVVYSEVPVLDEQGQVKLDKHDEPVMKRGKPIIERKYSDTLLVTLLKARMPEKYKEKQQIEHSGGIQTSITDDLRLLSNEQLAQFKQWVLDAKDR